MGLLSLLVPVCPSTETGTSLNQSHIGLPKLFVLPLALSAWLQQYWDSAHCHKRELYGHPRHS